MHERTVNIEFTVAYETEGRLEDNDLRFIVHTASHPFGAMQSNRLEMCDYPRQLSHHIQMKAQHAHIDELRRERKRR